MSARVDVNQTTMCSWPQRSLGFQHGSIIKLL